MEERIIEKLRKILELSRMGIAGEKETAKLALERLLDKYGLEVEDLDALDKRRYDFPFVSKYERHLFVQIYAMVCNATQFAGGQYRRKKCLVVELTPLQYAEISLLWKVYRAALKEEFEKTFDAFIMKHNLYAPGNISEDELSSEELERLRKVSSMARSMDDVSIPRALIDERGGS